MNNQDLFAAPRTLFSLAGRVALVTGASSGLGFEMACGLAAFGATVWLNGRDQSRADSAVRVLEGAGGNVRSIIFDVTDARAMAAGLSRIAGMDGRLDIVISNVGTRARMPVAELSTTAFASSLAANLTAAYGLAQSAAPLMARHGTGRIILLSSIAASRAAIAAMRPI